MNKFVRLFILWTVFLIPVNPVASALSEEKAEEGKDPSESFELVSYKIGSGDVLQIVTWKEPDFSRREVLSLFSYNLKIHLSSQNPPPPRVWVCVVRAVAVSTVDFL